jgi:hypothetical protein
MPQRSGTSPAILAIIGAAIAAGAAASLLAVASPVFVSTATPLTYLTLSPLVLGILLLAPVLVGAIGMVLGKVVTSEIPLRRQLGAMGAVAMLFAAAILLVLSHVGQAPGLFGDVPGAGGGGGGVTNSTDESGGNNASGNGHGINGTGGGQSGGGNDSANQTHNSTNGTTNSTGPGGGGNTTTNHTGGGHNTSQPKTNSSGSTLAHSLDLWGLPDWAPLVAVALIGFAGVAFVVPALARRRPRSGPMVIVPPPPPIATLRAETQAALADAAAWLDQTHDPRAVIVDLYGRLLGEITAYSGSLAARTAEEIRYGCLLRLGVRAQAAAELTRLFEEARYSSHRLDAVTIQRALAAIHAAEVDLGGIQRPR